MPEKLAVLVQNELNLNLNEIFSDAVERGIQIRHLPLYHTQDEKEVIRAARDCNYVIAGREPWNLKTLAACSKDLKLIVRFGAGYDTVDLMSATEFGIAVANAPGANARAVAEHTLALMMSVLRNVTRYDRELRAGGVVSKMSQTLEGTVALVGFGNIGQEVARLLQVFPVRVIAYDPYPNYEKAAELGVEIVSMNQAIEQADIISLHLPGTEEMRDFIDSKTISQMKDGVYIGMPPSSRSGWCTAKSTTMPRLTKFSNKNRLARAMFSSRENSFCKAMSKLYASWAFFPRSAFSTAFHRVWRSAYSGGAWDGKRMSEQITPPLRV